MHVFLTRSAHHLRDAIALPFFDYMLVKASDGELLLTIPHILKGERVVVIAGTQAPAENIIELMLLLDTLTRMQVASIHLFFTYFGYARQSIGSRMITTMLRPYPIARIATMHAHAPQQLNDLLTFEQVIDYDFFCDAARHADIIVAPDRGAHALAHVVARRLGKSVLTLCKKRLNDRTVRVDDVGLRLKGKRAIVVDDIIATGNTLLHAAHALKKAGVNHLSAAVTHSTGGLEVQRQLLRVFDALHVTNTIVQYKERRVIVHDSGPLIRRHLM